MSITSKHFEMINEFIPYFNSFYGVNSIYSHGRDYTSADIMVAMCLLFTQKPDHKFEGDSMDREYIRDIMLTSVTMLKRFEKKAA
jgi:hypothetical protein